jgi:hypothetical protein
LRAGVVLIVAGMAGCQDSAVGTIRADRAAVEQLRRANSDRPKSASKKSRRRPDFNDISPKFRGEEVRP